MTTSRMASDGRIDGALMNEAGRWMVAIDDPEAATVACARVSSHDQKRGPDRQIARIPEWAAANDIKVDRFVRKVASGLTDRRRQLDKLLRDPRCRRIIADHRETSGAFRGHARRPSHTPALNR
jgi:predicted site-specific integrase-resolvase